MAVRNAEGNSSSLVAWVVFLPPALLGALTVVILAGTVVGWNPLWDAGDVTLSEAVALRDVVMMRTMIGSGTDPNVKYGVRERLVKSNDVQLTPLEAAVTTRERYLVEELLNHGAVADAAERRRLACFARNERADDLVAYFAPGDEPLDCQTVSLPW